MRSNGPYPKLGFITEGDVSVNNYGLFIQDAWTLNNKLTLNLGLRTENEKVPTYTTAEGVPTYAVEFPFSDKLAPRLGFAYDVKGDGRWKVYGSWGIFYDIFKLELPRGSWGGDKWLEYHYSLDTYVFDTLAGFGQLPAGVPGHAAPRPDRLPSPLARRGLRRARSEADEEPGVLDGLRAPALAGDGPQRPLGPQVGHDGG